MHFPFYVFRDKLAAGLAEGQSAYALKDLAEYYHGPQPHELTEVFVNPGYTLEDLVAAFQKHPDADERQASWLNAQVHKALYGVEDYVYHWFRLGQMAIAMLRDSRLPDEAYRANLATFLAATAGCGLTEAEKEKLSLLLAHLRAELFRHTARHPFTLTGPVFAGLSEIAVAHDQRARPAVAGDATLMKIVALIVLMGLGLLGFVFLPLEKAILWLLFTAIAIPPLMAVMFEGQKLSGANIVELYKAGLGGLPVVGKLFGPK